MLFKKENFEKLLFKLDRPTYKIVFTTMSSLINSTPINITNSSSSITDVQSAGYNRFSVVLDFRNLFYISVIIKKAKPKIYFNIRSIESISILDDIYRIDIPVVSKNNCISNEYDYGKILSLEFIYAFKIYENEKENLEPIKIMNKWYFIDRTNDIHTWRYKFDENGNMTSNIIRGDKNSKNIKRFHVEPKREVVCIKELKDVTIFKCSKQEFNFSKNIRTK